MEPSEPTKPHITRQYYETVSQAVYDLLDFIDLQFLKDPVKERLEHQSTRIYVGKDFVQDQKERLRWFLLCDMYAGQLKMNSTLQANDKEALGLVLYGYLLCKKEKSRFPYYGLKELDEMFYTAFTSLLECLPTPVYQESIFFIDTILQDANPSAVEEYRVLMYRYFSIVSKTDGIVTPTEQTFLSSVMTGGKRATAESQDKVPPIDKNEPLIIAESTNQPMEALKQLIGLSSVKKEIETLRNFIQVQQVRKKQGLPVSSVSYHCVFTGNPGTGKTTVARIVANIYKELGILQKGHLVETDRSGLVAEYVGQTAVKTNNIIDSALDGVLFIDEAYSLIGSGADYGKEAIATLLKRMEDDRERLVVILAGYTKEMKDFIETNPGLQSRFNRYIEFPDYSVQELEEIYASNLKKYKYSLTQEAKTLLHKILAEAVASKDKNFGNGRFVRNLFEKTIEKQADRLAAIGSITQKQLTTIEATDLPTK